MALAEADLQTSSATAGGDLTFSTFDPSNAVSPISIVEGPGVKVGEGTVLHPVFGVETGFTSNVFYNETSEPAGILRLMAQIGTASLNQGRLSPSASGEEVPGDTGAFQYKADLRLAYDQPLSSNNTVTSTGGLGIGATFRGMVNPMGRFSFGFDEGFLRMIRASNFETRTNENRDVNTLQLSLLWHPEDRSLSAYFYARNTIDVFEKTGTLYPDRMDSRVGFHPMWRLFPQTTIYADASIGYVDGLGSSTATAQKVASMPRVLRAGIATLLTVKTSVNLSAGYTNGFYASGSNFSAPVVDAGVTYRYSPMGKLTVSYGLAYADSLNANYYRDHVLRAQIQHLVVPFALLVEPSIHLREYNGVSVMNASSPVRDDVIASVTAGMFYNFRNWIAMTLNYRFTTVQTDFTYMEATGQTVDPSYNRHELLLGVRAAL
ncbi:MAG: hypothetical protein NT062_09290 [Proteobacteria bacterium]|nr:hypothetical protein [Pseudomonadota bacterium]